MTECPFPTKEELLEAASPVLDKMVAMGSDSLRAMFEAGAHKAIIIVARNAAATELDALYAAWSNERSGAADEAQGGST